MSVVELSLLIPFRGRRCHLKSVLPRIEQDDLVRSGKCEVIAIEADNKPHNKEYIESLGFRYYFMQSDGMFHKTALLNLGLENAKGEIVAPYDVDLVPHTPFTLTTHLNMALKNPDLLISGYHLKSTTESMELDDEFDYDNLFTPPWFHPSFVKNMLLSGKRFGVVPFFNRQRLLKISGWDEHYIGWGSEDQDIIERYIEPGLQMIHSLDLLYIHLWHEKNESWRESEYSYRNRKYYTSSRPELQVNTELLGAESSLQQGHKFMEFDKWQEAEKAYISALQKRPNYAEAYQGLALAYIMQGNDDAAAISFEKIAFINSKIE